MKKIIICLLLLITTPLYAANVFIEGELGKNCLAHYKFNDQSGTEILDSSHYNRTGTSTSDATVMSVGGRLGFAFDFDGDSNKIDCASDFITTSPFSFCAWINLDSAGEGGNARLLSNLKTEILTAVAGTEIWITNRASAFGEQDSLKLVLGNWYFITTTRDVAGAWRLYIDGVEAVLTNTSPDALLAGTTNVVIGNRDATNKTVEGRIDNVMIFDRVLTLKEIELLYNAGKGTETVTGRVSEVLGRKAGINRESEN